MKTILVAALIAVLFTVAFVDARRFGGRRHRRGGHKLGKFMIDCWKKGGSYDECKLALKALKFGEEQEKKEQEQKEVSSPLSDSEGSCYTVTASSLNVRSGPSTGYRSVGSVSYGQQVTEYERQGSWSKIGYGRWVHNGYITACSSSSSPSTPSTGSSSGFSIDTLKRIMPRLSSSKASEYYPHLVKAMNEGSINNCPRRAAFLAQLAHESGQLQWWEEFASGAAYEGRRDLGNTQPGDGRRFKGRGPIQLTGRANYRSAGQALGLPLESNPEMAKRTDVGFRTAVWFWKTRNLNNYADGSQSGFDKITRRINGGYNGKADRDQYFRKAKSAMGC